MSVIVCTVNLRAPERKDYFFRFLIAPASTGLGSSTLILNRLEDLNMPLQGWRGQSYDNGANMYECAQARLLVKNS